MILSDSYRATQAKLVSLLASLGWEAANSPVALGIKTYQTAVGPKQAVAYLQPSSEGDDGAYFQATYESEGNNVLSSLPAYWKMVQYTSDDAELAARAAEFNAQVDAHVADTYAMRLARKDRA